jgi:hypothetical protein
MISLRPLGFRLRWELICYTGLKHVSHLSFIAVSLLSHAWLWTHGSLRDKLDSLRQGWEWSGLVRVGLALERCAATTSED